MGLISKLMLLCLALAGLAGCAKTIHPTEESLPLPPGGLVSDTGRPLAPEKFLAAARDADFILVGEGHTNACDHDTQNVILKMLVRAGVRPAIGLEMVAVDRQPVLDRFHRREIPPDTLAKALNWEDSWGYPYDLYAPLFTTAFAHDLPVIALNLDRELVNRFGRQGRAGLTARERELLPERIIPPSEEQRTALEAQFAMHAAILGNEDRADEARKRFFAVQSLWDSQMAARALTTRRKHDGPVVILAGAGHVEHGWGIEYRLHILAPEKRCVRVVPIRDREDPPDMSGTADSPTSGLEFGFYCPSRHRSRLGLDLAWDEGVSRVTDVRAGSRAEQSGFQPGDILKRVNGKEIKSPMDLHTAGMQAFREKEALIFVVERNGTEKELAVRLGQKKNETP